MNEVRALLLTNVVDSTQLSQTLGDAAMAELWAAHDRVARDLLLARGGSEIGKTDGMLPAVRRRRRRAGLRGLLSPRAEAPGGTTLTDKDFPTDAKHRKRDDARRTTGRTLGASGVGQQPVVPTAPQRSLRKPWARMLPHSRNASNSTAALW